MLNKESDARSQRGQILGIRRSAERSILFQPLKLESVEKNSALGVRSSSQGNAGTMATCSTSEFRCRTLMSQRKRRVIFENFPFPSSSRVLAPRAPRLPLNPSSHQSSSFHSCFFFRLLLGPITFTLYCKQPPTRPEAPVPRL